MDCDSTPRIVNTQALQQLILTMTKTLGLSLWGMEYRSSCHHSVIRIYVETLTTEAKAETSVTRHNVDIDTLAKLSRHLTIALDAEEHILGNYTLEVSSPGLRRTFFQATQLPAFVGRKLRVECAMPLPSFASNRQRLTGRLDSVDGTRFILNVDEQPVELRWDDCKKIQLIHHFPSPCKPNKLKSKKQKQNNKNFVKKTVGQIDKDSAAAV